ncbi:extra-cytoplasmic solute receptor [Ahrensia sp. R2A130]|nr:extra-cytoplasmic solute receptor [Ahrensia sp. R2A130]
MKKFWLAATTALTFAATAFAPAHAEFPEKPVTLIAPFNAGGGTDLLLRGLQQPFADALGGNAVVSNMSGGSGTVAASHLAGLTPDGYTLGYLSVTVSTIQPQIKNVPYDKESWTPICSVAASPTMFYVRPDAPYNSMEDVKAAIEADPGKLIFGSSGPGAITHLTMVSAMEGLGVSDKVKHLPHKGSGPAMKSMAGGIIQFFGDTEVMMSKYELKPLAVFSDARLPSLPDVPTATEVGIKPPLNELYLWGGLFAPKGLPEDVTAKLASACETAVASDAFQDFAKKTGTVINQRGPKEFDEFFRAQWDANKALIKAAGL